MSRSGKNITLAAWAALGAIAALLAAPAQAQQIYRSVGPDGKVTFSDQPPLSGHASMKSRSGSDLPGSSDSGLPYALQQVVNKFPVTLYSSRDCEPCASARRLLAARGVPFAERTIDSNESAESLKQISGASTVPFATIGGQHLNGFSETEWSQYLDAAGYPRKSQLPTTYRAPAATPLVAAKETPATAASRQPEPVAPKPRNAPPAADADAVAPAGPTPSNPAGIVF